MEGFNELIRNFDKIRGYMRHFAVYGSKKREDFTHKSSRTYDNERRRIQSYLGEYVDEQTSSSGKRLCIHFDSLMIQTNPFFEVFKTKSFTKNDILLHFTLLDLFQYHHRLSVTEICTYLSDHYLTYFKEDKALDARTIRLKLEEYVTLGLLENQKEGKTLYYFLPPHLLDDIPASVLNHLYQAIAYFQNIAPVGILGHFILERASNVPSPFAFPDLRFSHTLDEQILLYLLEAIKAHCVVKIFHTGHHYTLALPIKIVDNVEQGRRYVIVYQYSINRYKFYRLDRISKVILTDHVDETYPTKLSIATALLQNSWGVALDNARHGAMLETWSLLLSFDEEKDQAYLQEIMRYTPTAILQRTAPNTYSYTLSVIEAHEMTPWLRRLIGHILHIECTNPIIQNSFIQDIKVVHHFYQNDKEDFFSQSLNLNKAICANPRTSTMNLASHDAVFREKKVKLQLELTEKPATYELFHKLYSKYYSLAKFILHKAHTQPISLNTIRQIVSEKGFLESGSYFTPLMTSQTAQDYQLLYEDEPHTYCSILKAPPLFFLTHLEKAWLCAILEDPKIHLFLEEEEYFILRQRFKSIYPLYEPHTVSYIQQKKNHSFYEDPCYQAHFKTLLKALEKHEQMKLYYKEGTKSTSSYYLPYKLKYHLKSDSFSLLAIQVEEDTLLNLKLIPLTHIQKIECLGTYHPPQTLQNFVATCKASTPITFWLSNKRSGFDRVLMYLSNYERTTTFDERSNSCIVQLHYYPFEEDALIETLLSFGPIIKVLSPQTVVTKIKNKIDEQYQLFAKFFS